MSHEPGNTLATHASRQTGPGVTRVRRAVVAVVGVVAVVVVASASSTAFAAGATVGVATSSNFGTVLVDAQGFALYTFPQDRNGMSACTGPCIPVWPALTVPAGTTPTAGTGVTGTVASVLQSNSTYQVTYNGSPLYTFVGDTSPGQVSGNNIGGFTVVQVSATTPTTAAPAPTTGSTTPSPTTAPPAPTTATTRPPAAGSTTPPAASPATAATASGPSSAPASSSSPAPAAAPTSLAFTGPGPGLIWMIAVGSMLIVVSIAMLLLLGDVDRLARATFGRASRITGWLLGR